MSVFERITPTPDYPQGTSNDLLQSKKWSSQTAVVKAFKDGLKSTLRKAQQGLCCYCRRQLYDDYAVHIEHFVDKDKYPAYTFEIKNLALSCGTCNINKNGRFNSIRARYNTLFRSIGPRLPIVPTVKGWLHPSAPFPGSAAAFRWVSPHFHDYSQHISKDSFVFLGLSPEGWRTIRGCRLNDLAKVEERVFKERLNRRANGEYSELMADLDKLGEQEMVEIFRRVALGIKEIRRND